MGTFPSRDTIPRLGSLDPSSRYTGAGIGGGYHAAGGSINISSDAVVQTTAGVLPSDEVLNRAAILAGITYKAPQSDWHSYAIGNGAGATGGSTIVIYKGGVRNCLD